MYNWIIAISAPFTGEISIHHFQGPEDDMKTLLVRMMLEDSIDVWKNMAKEMEAIESRKNRCGYFSISAVYSGMRMTYAAQKLSSIQSLKHKNKSNLGISYPTLEYHV